MGDVSIHLEAWKIHKNTLLRLGQAPVDLVLGFNGHGKSSIIDGLEFVLRGTGKLAGLHTKAELGALAIGDGFEDCCVTLRVDGYAVSREMQRDGTQTIALREGDGAPIEGKIRAQQQRIDDRFSLDADKLAAALDARRLLDGDANTRRGILFGAVGAGVTREQVLERFRALGLEGDDVQKAAGNAVERGWRSAEETAGEKRAAAGRDLKALTCPEPAQQFTPEGATEALDLSRWTQEKIEERMATNREGLRKVVAAEGADVGGAAEALRAAKAEQERAESERDILNQPAGTGLEVLRNILTETQQEADEAAEAVEICAADVEKAGAMPLAEAGEIERPKVCPVIPGGPACPMTPTKLKAHREKLAGEADALRDARTAALNAANGQRNLAEERDSTARQRLETARETFEAEEERRRSLARVDSRLDAIEIDVKAKEEALAAVEAVAASGSGDREFFEKRIARTVQMQEALTRYLDDLAAVETFEANRAALREKRERADKIAQALNPSGIESEILAELLGPLQEKLNEVGDHLGAIRVRSDLEIEMLWRGVWRRYQQLSESTRERMAVAVQHALTSLAGFPILVVDRVDHFDAEGKGALLRALVHVAPRYQAVLALATCQSSPPVPATLAGVDSWFLEGGDKLTRLEVANG